MSKKMITVLALAFCLTIPAAAFANGHPYCPPATDPVHPIVTTSAITDSYNDNSKVMTLNDNDQKWINHQEWTNDQTWTTDTDTKTIDSNNLCYDLNYEETCINNSGNTGVLVQDSDDTFALGIRDVDINVSTLTAYSGNTGSFNYSYCDVGNTDYDNVANTDNSKVDITKNMLSGNTTNVSLNDVLNDKSIDTDTRMKVVDVDKTETETTNIAHESFNTTTDTDTDMLNGADIVENSSLTGSGIDSIIVPATTVADPTHHDNH